MTLVFRINAKNSSGGQSFASCLALAQAWQDSGGEAIFVMVAVTPSIAEHLASERIAIVELSGAAPGSIEDANEVATLAREHNAEWVVLDGIQFGADYQCTLKSLGLRVLCLDHDNQIDNKLDAAASRDSYSADLLLNAHPAASPSQYPNLSAASQLLLGPGYALLTRDFNPYRTRIRSIARFPWNVLILGPNRVGTSDPLGLIPLAIAALETIATPPARVKRHNAAGSVPTPPPQNPDTYEFGQFDVTVVANITAHSTDLSDIGLDETDAGLPDIGHAPIEAAISRSRHNIRTVNSDGTHTESMAQLIANADLVLAATVDLAAEICFLGLPAVFFGIRADNGATTTLSTTPMALAQHLHQRGAAVLVPSGICVTSAELAFYTSYLTVSAPTRKLLSDHARSVVDGWGTDRVVAHLQGKPEPVAGRVVNSQP